jgi:hypothetical protein
MNGSECCVNGAIKLSDFVRNMTTFGQVLIRFSSSIYLEKVAN